MNRKILFLVLCAFFLAESCHHIKAIAVDKSKENLSPRLKLLVDGLEKIWPLLTESLDHKNGPLITLLNDPTVSGTPSEELRTHLAKISNYNEKRDATEIVFKEFAKKLPPKHATTNETWQKLTDITREILEINFELNEILQKYNTSAVLKKPSKEDLIIREALQKTDDFGQIEKRFSNKADTFIAEFQKSFNEYAARVSAEERASDSKIFDWFEQFKGAPGVEKFAQFFNLYTDKDFIAWAKTH